MKDFNGKQKAVTFSYDDGVTQDIYLINLLNKYNLKCTFNLNSEFLGNPGILTRDGLPVSHYKIAPQDVKHIYDGHEVAVHTLTHPNLATVDDEREIIRQVEQDRLNLSELVGYEVVGMAYPGGGVNNNDFAADVIKNHTGVKYARTTTLTDSFDRQDNLYRFKPNVCHIMDTDRLFQTGERFLNLKADKPQILYIWGHSYEMDFKNRWGVLEEFFQMISGRSDIFYGTNAEVLL